MSGEGGSLFWTGIKLILIPLFVWIVNLAILWTGDPSIMYQFNAIMPPQPPQGGTWVDMMGYVGGLFGYVFNVIGFFITTLGKVVMLSFIPAPYNYLIAIPFIVLFAVGMLLILYSVASKIGSGLSSLIGAVAGGAA